MYSSEQLLRPQPNIMKNNIYRFVHSLSKKKTQVQLSFSLLPLPCPACPLPIPHPTESKMHLLNTTSERVFARATPRVRACFHFRKREKGEEGHKASMTIEDTSPDTSTPNMADEGIEPDAPKPIKKTMSKLPEGVKRERKRKHVPFPDLPVVVAVELAPGTSVAVTVS